MRAPTVRYNCPREWDELTGDRVQRHCPHCNETVTNLSAMDPAAARRFVDEHPDACLRFRADAAGRIAFDRRHLAVLATAVTLAGCTSWHEADELVAPPDALASARDEAAVPDDAWPDDEEDEDPRDDALSPEDAQPLARSSEGASAVPAPHDPDPPELHRAERPVPELSRRERRELQRRFRPRGRASTTKGR
jgi:hypothetical protein